MKRLSLAVFSVLAACASAISDPRSVEPGQQFTLTPGQAANIGTVTVLLVQVNDSRCPSDVVCVTAGEALTILKFNGAGDDRTDTLHFFKPVTAKAYGNLAVGVLDVTPYPVSTQMGATKTVTLSTVVLK